MSLVLESLAAEIAFKAAIVCKEEDPKTAELQRVSSKLILLSENKYEDLWLMENEDRVKLEKETMQLTNQIEAQRYMINHLTQELNELKNSKTTMLVASPLLQKKPLTPESLKW
jgi:hypothetical protein